MEGDFLGCSRLFTDSFGKFLVEKVTGHKQNIIECAGNNLREFTSLPDIRKGSRACARDGTGDGVGTRKVECQE